MASDTGRARCARATPTGTSTSRISSVAYAVEEIGSEENTARATFLVMRSWTRSAVFNGGAGNTPLGREADGRDRPGVADKPHLGRYDGGRPVVVVATFAARKDLSCTSSSWDAAGSAPSWPRGW